MLKMTVTTLSPDKWKFKCESCKTREFVYGLNVSHLLHIALVVVAGGRRLISDTAQVIRNLFWPWICVARDPIQKASRKKYTKDEDWQEKCRRMYRRVPSMSVDT